MAHHTNEHIKVWKEPFFFFPPYEAPETFPESQNTNQQSATTRPPDPLTGEKE